MSKVIAFPYKASPDQPRMLELGERVFLWGFRAIAQHHQYRRPIMAAVEQVYAQYHVEDAIVLMDALVEAFGCTAHTAIGLHNPRCPCLSESEASLLRAMAMAQAGDLRAARREFERWLPELAADWVLQPAYTIGRMFQTGGMLLPLRDAPPAEHNKIADTWTSSVVSNTCH